MTRDELIISNMDLAQIHARKLRTAGIPVEDLEQYGMVGLIQAADSYDSTRAGFRTYAGHKVRSAIQDAIRRETKTRSYGEGVVLLDPDQYAPIAVDDPQFKAIEDRLEIQALIDSVPANKSKVVRITNRNIRAEHKQSEIAAAEGVGQSRVSQMVREGLDELRLAGKAA